MRKFILTPLVAALVMAMTPAAHAVEDDLSVVNSEYVTNDTLVVNSLTSRESTHRAAATWMTRINRPANNQLGLGNGTGVVVGVVDTGIRGTHDSLTGQVSAGASYLGGTDITDQRGHGTMISGIIAGDFNSVGKAEGVAPGASIAMYKAFGTLSTVSNTVIANGINWAVNEQRVPILNLSLGSTSTTAIAGAVDNATARGTLVVAAMGNTGKVGAMYPAKLAMYSLARDSIIAVGGLSYSGDVRYNSSSWDPTIAQWTVFAPGNAVYTTHYSADSGYAFVTGTSAAAPQVAGQAALLKSNWNFLTAPQMSQIIFSTATRLCSNGGTGLTNVTQCNTAGPDPVFGWGLINVAKSLQPIGTLYLPTASGDTINFKSARLNSGRGGVPATMSSLTTIAVDNYRRGFYVDVGSTISGSTVTTTSTPTSGDTATVTTASGLALTAGYAYVGSDKTVAFSKMAVGFADKNGAGWNMGFGGTSSQFFGLSATGTAPLSLNGEGSKFNTPYYSFANNGSHAGYSVAFDETTVVRVGTMVQGADGNSAITGVPTMVAPLAVSTVEVQKKFGDDVVVMSLGNMQENNAALGMNGQGAMALAANTNTTFMSFAGSKAIGTNTYVSAMVSFGSTGAYKNATASLIDGASATQSQAWSMGIAQRNLFKDGDSLGFTVAMPLRTTGGEISVTTATAQSQVDGSLTYATQTMGLVPSGMQKDLELAYTRPAMFGGNVSAIAQAKLEPGHVAGAATQYGIGFKYTKAF